MYFMENKARFHPLIHPYNFFKLIILEQVNPNSGPYQGGTDVTITGTDLGVVFEDINNIIIGESLCRVYNDSY